METKEQKWVQIPIYLWESEIYSFSNGEYSEFQKVLRLLEGLTGTQPHEISLESKIDASQSLIGTSAGSQVGDQC